MAKKKTSSAKKPAKKAATPSPSITSSTTAAIKSEKRAEPRKRPGDPDEPNALESPEEYKPLAPAEQSAILELLSRGASPAGACAQVGVPIEAFFQTAASDPAFRGKVREIAGVLSGNVQAVLYRTAMEGNVSAQQAFLKLFPPPSFQEPKTETEPITFDELLGDLSDAELVELARAVGVDLENETEAGLAAPNLSYLAEQISRHFAVDA